MKSRPILFSAPMVRALLNGSKTQTRRVVKPQPIPNHRGNFKFDTMTDDDGIESYWYINPFWHTRCPYGAVGDRLWVRETFQGPLIDAMDAYRAEPSDFQSPAFCVYAADGGAAPEFVTDDDELVCRWRPSIFMPRWASRITLEITCVRVERLNEISEVDAIAEGAIDAASAATIAARRNVMAAPDVIGTDGKVHENAITAYHHLWESINGTGSWAANPWVWVVSFRRVM